MGLLDNILGTSFDDPRTGALLRAAGLLGSAPKVMQGLNQGLLAYGDTMAEAKQRAAAEELRKLQMQREQLGLQTGQLQLSQMQQQIARQNAIRDDLTKMETGGAKPAPMPAAMSQSSAFTPEYNQVRAERAQAAGVPAQAQPGNLTDNLTQRLVAQAGVYAKNGDFETANKLYEQAAKFMPEVKEISVSMQNGQPVNVITYKNGKQEVSGFAPTPKVHWLDNGGAIQAVDELTQKPLGGAFKKTVSPDTLFGGQVTMRGQNMTDARARELNAITREGQQTQVVTDPVRGTMLVNKGTGLMRPAVGLDGQAVPSEEKVKAGKQSNQLFAAIGEAEKLMGQNPTASGVGSVIDKALNFVGKSTQSGDVAAQLDTLSGWLVANVPRMEGPQSNFDVANYQTMAGLVGDRTKPISTRMAALGTMKGLMQKYATINGMQQASTPNQPIPGLKFLGFEGQ